MNKLFTKIASLALGAAMAFGVGVAVGSNREATSVEAATSTLTIQTSDFTTKSYADNNKEHTTGTIKWVSNQVMQNSNVMQWQKNNGYIYNTTDLGTIKSVTVNSSAGSFTTYYGTSEHPTSGTTVGGGYFTVKVGNATGKTTSIVVTYESGSSDTTTALSVSPNSWTGYDSQTINVSNYTVSCTSTKSPGYEFQGIGSGSGDNFVARVADFTSGCPTTADTRLQWKAKYPTTAGGSTYLYAYVSLTVTADSVNSIVISGSMTKTTYSQGDAWDPTGFTVNAYYASAPSTPFDVTSDANLSWSYDPATTASTSTTSVTCTASFGGKSATSSAQSVTINEKTNLGGIVSGEKYFIISTYNSAEYYLKSFSSTSAVSDSAAAWPGDSNMPSTDTDAWTFTATETDDCWSVTNNDGDTLYSIADNNGLRSGTSDHVWQLAMVSSGLRMYNTAHSGERGMYLTVYQGSNWRTYNATGTQGDECSIIRFVKYVAPATAATINGANEVVIGSSWSPTSVTENVGGATVTGVTFAFAASGGATLTAQDPATGAFTSSTAGTVVVSGTKSGYTITSKTVTVVDNTPFINLTRTSAEDAYTGQTVSITASFGNGVTDLNWTVQSGSVTGATSSDSGYSAKIAGSTGTLTIRATDTGSALYSEVSVNVTKTAFTTSPSNASVAEGKTTALSATLNSGGTINWSSSDNTVATVAAGVVTGVEEGSATITAQSVDDTSVTATCTITVTEAPGEIVVTSAEIANFANSYAERDWTYGSGTSAISGKIKAYKNGDNIQLNHNNICYFYNTDAVPGYITGITFTKVSGTTDLTAWVGDEVLSSDPAEGGTTNTTYTWSFNAEDKHSYFRVATSGSTGARVFSSLTITYEKISLVDATSITINDKTPISMDTYGYGKRNLTATVGPVNARDKTVTWGTTNSSVVTVSNGVLTPVGVGDATVYATAVGYVSDQATPDLKDSVTVHVTQALYKKATFTPTSTTTLTQGDDYLSGGSASLSATSAGSWNSDKSAIQLGAGKDVSFTISGYANMQITGIDMVVSSNGNAGSGSLSVTAGTTNVLTIETAAFEDSSWNGAYDANPVQLYRDITDYVVKDAETIVFAFSASVNSLYIHSVSIRYLDYHLESWCENFLDQITCDGVGSITDDSKWDDLGIEFLNLDEDLRNIAAEATANKDSDSVIEQAMARYDLILRKYGIGTGAGQHEDFIERFGVGKVNGPLSIVQTVFKTNEASSTIAVVVVSMIGLSAVGGFFFLRKRKEI